MRNHKFGAHLTPGNGKGRKDAVDRDLEKQQERTRNLRFAIFYLVVGLLLFLANEFAKQPQAGGSQPNALSSVGLDLYVGRKPEPTAAAPTEGTTYIVRFRLTNRGNQSVFYPVYPGTNRPVGRLVYRTAAGSEWVERSWPKGLTSTSPQPSVAGKLTWVEMPPGGWIDGMYSDPGFPGEDHAYEIDLKLGTGDNVVRLISQAYRVNAN